MAVEAALDEVLVRFRALSVCSPPLSRFFSRGVAWVAKRHRKSRVRPPSEGRWLVAVDDESRAEDQQQDQQQPRNRAK